MNAYTCFAHAFAAHRSATFLESERGERYSYTELENKSARLAALLTASGLCPGERIAVQVDKSPQAIFLYLACLRAGLCYLPLNTAYQRDELRYFLDDATPRMIVCRPAARTLYDALCAGSDAMLHTLDEDGGGSLVDAARDMPARFDDVARADDDTAVIIYTSGTTGRSKGAMVTHGNLTSNARALTELWRFSARDVLLHALPLFHVHGLFVALHTVLLSGARLLFHRHFDAAAIVRALPAATVLMGVPTFYVRLLREPALTRATVAHMRLFVSGSAPLLAATFAAWQARTGHAVLERYGMSEAGMITSNPYEGERRAGTVGLPLPGVQLRIADECDAPLPVDTPGMIQIRGPNVYAGYWRMPERTREESTADGWFRTGDIGTRDADGYVRIVGRAKDLIITGGYNVYPKEIELLIDALPGVAESAVIGTPDADWGETVIAAVVRAAQETRSAQGAQSALDEATIIAQLRARLAHYKVPRRVHFIDALPRNAMGKVQKNALRERFGVR